MHGASGRGLVSVVGAVPYQTHEIRYNSNLGYSIVFRTNKDTCAPKMSELSSNNECGYKREREKVLSI
jgi:hypothetical protein